MEPCNPESEGDHRVEEDDIDFKGEIPGMTISATPRQDSVGNRWIRLQFR